MSGNNSTSGTPGDARKGISDEEVKKESSEAAQKSLDAQRKAYELRQAAHGAADPEERQKLLEEAIDKEVEAESFGKTAKYLRSGTFQGFAMGTGIGTAPGATLGALTGTLVGGVTSLITGGLGGAIGAGVGALHGPWWNVGEVAGKGIQKVTGNMNSSKATWEQKQQLETMIKDVRNQDMPREDELEKMKRDRPKTSWSESASSMMPSWPSWGKSQKGEGGSGEADSTKVQSSEPASSSPGKTSDVQRVDEQGVDRLKQAQAQSEASRTSTTSGSPGQAPRKKPRKLEVRSQPAGGRSTGQAEERKDAQTVKKRPRKLETRSKPVATAG